MGRLPPGTEALFDALIPLPGRGQLDFYQAVAISEALSGIGVPTTVQVGKFDDPDTGMMRGVIAFSVGDALYGGDGVYGWDALLARSVGSDVDTSKLVFKPNITGHYTLAKLLDQLHSTPGSPSPLDTKAIEQLHDLAGAARTTLQAFQISQGTEATTHQRRAGSRL